MFWLSVWHLSTLHHAVDLFYPWMSCLLIIILIFFKIYLIERESLQVWEKERQRSRLPIEHGAWHQGWGCGAQSHNPEIMTWAKIKNQTLNQLSYPGTPKIVTFLCSCLLIQSKNVRSILCTRVWIELFAECAQTYQIFFFLLP